MRDFILNLFLLMLSVFVSTLYSIINKFYYEAKENKKEKKEPDISKKIELISKKLNKSSIELSDLQKELERKVQFVNDLNAEANQAQSLLSLSHDQIEAIKTMLNKETQKENRASFWKNVLVNTIFFILGAIASYIISKYLV